MWLFLNQKIIAKKNPWKTPKEARNVKASIVNIRNKYTKKAGEIVA
jgi:hypothetical protein